MPELVAHVLRVDLERWEPVVRIAKQPQPLETFLEQHPDHVVAVINGGYFDPEGAVMGLRVSQGWERTALLPGADWGVLEATASRARLLHTRDFTPGSTLDFAIQSGPRLVVDGKAMTFKPNLPHRRTAVGYVEREPQTLVFVATEGALTLGALAEALARDPDAGGLGLEQALNLDGGPSTGLFVPAHDVRLPTTGAVAEALFIMPRGR